MSDDQERRAISVLLDLGWVRKRALEAAAMVARLYAQPHRPHRYGTLWRLCHAYDVEWREVEQELRRLDVDADMLSGVEPDEGKLLRVAAVLEEEASAL